MQKLGSALLCWIAALVVHHSHGAERLDARSLLRHALHKRQLTTEPATSYPFKRNANHLPMRDLDEVLSLGQDSHLEVVQETVTVQGSRLFKMQERYKDTEVPEGVVTVETDQSGNKVFDTTGTVFRNIHLDMKENVHLSSEAALDMCLQHFGDDHRRNSLWHINVKAEVLFDNNNEAFPGYQTQYLVAEEGKAQRRPTCQINAKNSSITFSWDAIDNCTDCKATGVGGNLKIGKIKYGELQRCLDLRREDGVCYMENKYVRVLNNNFTWNLTDDEGNSDTPVASYDCKEIDDEINGAYSPLLDAFFYGTVVGKMFENWYGMSPLGDVMTFRVHFGYHYSNAFWNGFECTFGDGDGWYLHPLVSLDIVGHEVAHGITEKNSGLYYYQQWGGINEAFSDMTGETTEAYLEEADWMMGYDITVGDIPPIRFMDNPEKDNRSIAHADNYTEFLDPHLGSGVYNRAFYLLAHVYGIPIRDAYGAFLHANRMYWHHMSNYEYAACDVMKSAYDLGLDGSKFRKAFDEVGIEACDAEDHVLGLKHKEVYTDITVSKAISPTFVFAVPGQFVESITVKASSDNGDVYIILSDKRWGDVNDKAEVYAEGLHSVNYELPDNSSATYVTITLTTDSDTPLKDVSLMARFHCVEEFTPEGTYEDWVLYWFWMEICESDLNEESNESENSEEKDKSEGSEEKESSETSGEKEGSEEKESSELEDSTSKEEEDIPSKISTVSGHIFNFFRSFVIVVFPQSKK